MRSSSQQPPAIYVQCGTLQLQIEPVKYNLSPERSTASHVADGKLQITDEI